MLHDKYMTIIRELKKEDATQVAKLIIQLTKNIIDENNFISRIEKLAKVGDYQYFVAEIEDKVIGFAGLAWHPIPSKGLISWVEEVVVDERARGKGVGKKLMNQLLKLAKEKNCSQIKLTVSNPVAKALYEKLGFIKKDEEYLIKKFY